MKLFHAGKFDGEHLEYVEGHWTRNKSSDIENAWFERAAVGNTIERVHKVDVPEIFLAV